MKATTAIAVPTLLISDAMRSSCRLSGVFTSVISVDLRATRPISVESPTAVTVIRPLPFITIVERRAMLEG